MWITCRVLDDRQTGYITTMLTHFRSSKSLRNRPCNWVLSTCDSSTRDRIVTFLSLHQIKIHTARINILIGSFQRKRRRQIDDLSSHHFLMSASPAAYGNQKQSKPFVLLWTEETAANRRCTSGDSEPHFYTHTLRIAIDQTSRTGSMEWADSKRPPRFQQRQLQSTLFPLFMREFFPFSRRNGDTHTLSHYIVFGRNVSD